ncbi:glycoside hydrolase family 2 TIM barrel-domain containing protein [Paraflavitalea sp. CAU 1676]|uniref:glycoside hydrolase family 2 TIM barrel-domain containing protein n=1 Tax=Paraflavitalea sp. CAU 1676 TaxID=3032598 RepID=UPI0023DB3E4A|nr:glycoside hydrolase family 2 TIM barrel-domain containing protein [Paraflavitalea sp. CAU 1676]MDF2189916.1 glycoside hydrolase family 2 TIM barrel-domain containing protein [Paraflavitalea sp. CAU 1676]
MHPSFLPARRPSFRAAIFFLLTIAPFLSTNAQETIIKYLSGVDKDHTVNWDFFCTGGRNSGKWTSIAVPSCWELQGFGHYDYGRVKLEEQSEEVGKYRYRFQADKPWKGQTVKIVFEGSMTDTEVKINGKLAGPTHQGAFYRFTYDITALLKYGGSNLLEVEVKKKSANRSVNLAERDSDFWVFGGIFRPVYLEVTPTAHIDRLAIFAAASGDCRISVIKKGAGTAYKASAVITKANGQVITTENNLYVAGDTLDVLQYFVSKPDLWSPEFPNLYKVKVDLKDPQGKVVHTVEKKFGFRDAELRVGDGFYLNDKRVVFKGVNRHSFWPESGRTLSKAISIEDVQLMKDMNMNAVRMSHYPPDQHFLDVCDSLGLMVIDELTGWQKMYDDTTARRLVKELVIRDVNHPSIVLWANGNEGGFNRTVDNDYAKYDPQMRHVIHPWEKFYGTDTKHYPDYNYLTNAALNEREVFFPTEFMHGLYDGGHGAGLDDFWNLMQQTPRAAGGFLWSFADEGVVRRDHNDSIDTYKNNGPDGILGPHHEKEGSFYTIKEIWSPVYIAPQTINTTFNGQLLVENRYMFTNLAQCSFQWKLFNVEKEAMKTLATGKVQPVSILPGERKWLDLKLPAELDNATILHLTATDPYGREIFTWSWHISLGWVAMPPIDDSKVAKVTYSESGNELLVKVDNFTVHFDKTTGYLAKVVKGNEVLSLSGGPALAGFDQQLSSFTFKDLGKDVMVQAEYKGKDNWLKAIWMFRSGQMVQLNYTYSQRGDADYMGITFNYPEEKIKGMKWEGRGPYRVWKNRLKGMQYGVWDKDYNNTITGERGWQYPEFKGNHAEVAWARVRTSEFPFTVCPGGRFLQMLKPDAPQGAYNTNTTVNYPAGNIGILNAIQSIGTKFQAANVMGPQSQKNVQLNAPYEGLVWFDFR